MKSRTLTTALLIFSVGLFLLSGCSRKEAPTATEPQQSTSVDAATELRALADDVWADTIENSTYYRLQEGLPIEKFEDVTLENHRDQLTKIAGWRARLNAIQSNDLEGDDRITYEILAFQLADDGANNDDYWLTFDITAYVGPYAFTFAQQALGIQDIPDKVSADHYLHLVNEYADMIDQLTGKVLGQVERGIYLPQPALPSTRSTWQGVAAAAPAALRVSDDRLAALADADKAEFAAALDDLIKNRVESGFRGLLASIGDEYEAAAPEAVGLGQYPGGPDVYKRKVRVETTLNLTPDEIHQRGLTAVADISARMQELRRQLGFEGTAQEFHEQLKQDQRFIAANPAEVEERYMSFIRAIEPKLDGYFKYRPKAAYGVRRLPLAAEPGMTFGYYNPPSPDDPVGYYNYNGSDLENRSLIGAGSLIYHELLPGHHFHLATQKENDALQALRQNYSIAAFTEGWAEYAASLGIEMGMYDDPYDLYGRYIMEIFLATRLVVDTGMNAKGWTLEEARAFMSEHLYNSDVEIASESLRYSTNIPAQALAYRLGYEKLWELRRKTEEALGDRFDIRDFHDIVLSDGAKPLIVLEAKVDRYIESMRR